MCSQEERDALFNWVQEICRIPKSEGGILHPLELEQEYLLEALDVVILEYMDTYPSKELFKLELIEEMCRKARALRMREKRRQDRYNDKHTSLEQVNRNGQTYSLADASGKTEPSAEDEAVTQIRLNDCLKEMHPRYRSYIEQQLHPAECPEADKSFKSRVKKGFYQRWNE